MTNTLPLPFVFFFFFSSLVQKRHFSVSKVDQIFETGHIPEWLKSLLKDHAGRSLVYELFETHRNCVLLNFAVQKVWKDGHTAEVASVSSAAAIFTVFQPVAGNSSSELGGHRAHISVHTQSNAFRTLSLSCCYSN